VTEGAEAGCGGESNRPHVPQKKGADVRIRELLDERKRDRQRIEHLERQLSDRALEAERQKEASTALHAELEAKDRQLAQFRAEREEQQKSVPERIAKAREEGRRLFRDFDAVVGPVQLDRQAFEALLASGNAPELMYAAGLGVRLIGQFRQIQSQAQADKQRTDYYRQLHHQHFPGENNHGI